MNSLIAPSKTLGYSNIYIDFLYKSEMVKQFYPAASLEDVAVQIDKHKYNRIEIAAILEKQNRAFGTSEKVFENIELLKDEKSVCLCTGQQAGLFGGSMLIIIKALAIVKAAKLYSKQLDRPVIPIFWIAGDDHDYEEVNHTYVQDRTSQIVKISYDNDPDIHLPTSKLKFTDKEALDKAKQLLKDTLGETDFTDELYSLIDKSYTTKDSYVSSFGKIMTRLTSELGLVLFSPGDKDAKRLAVDLFKDIVNKQDQMHTCLSETNSKIQNDGYHLQVEKNDNSAHLFYNLKDRTAVMQDGDRFIVGDKSFSKDELLQKIDKEPEKFSSDVMTRPILQSFFFPVISQKGGAAEIAYLAQINKLFELFELPIPYYKARPTATIVEKRFEKLMGENQIQFEDIVGDIELVINRILSKTFPEDIENKFQSLINRIKCHFEDFSTETLNYEPSLESFAKQTMGKIDFTLKSFEGKVFSAHKRKSKESRERIYRLWHSLYPNRTFQERVLNISFFISRYGFDFVPFLYDKIDCEENAHQLIYMSEYK